MQPSSDRDGILIALTWLAAAATTAMAAWLLDVALLVLPSRDPGHVAFWIAVAGAFLAFAALTALHLAGRGGAGVSWLAGASALGAIAVGGWAAITMLASVGDFEGYIVLLGAGIALHGTLLLAHIARQRVGPMRARRAR